MASHGFLPRLDIALSRFQDPFSGFGGFNFGGAALAPGEAGKARVAAGLGAVVHQGLWG